ncbi:hypothetical protein DTO207G8_6891 [Paecilomyces variotii]|nr:hypothetical protein DTO207G8_6891 [Paecilomyces variotii]KAJ9265509.1 hypothetical protein DTO212C5_6702 [Paecilomyces variotii]KAJ9383511.1 hypothetical protein DTO063F5_5168 [Paecilomyces variotii]
MDAPYEFYRDRLPGPLIEAIDDLPKYFLRNLVKDLCVNVRGARKRTANRLLLTYRDPKPDEGSTAASPDKNKDEDGQKENDKTQPGKRKLDAAPAPVAGTKRIKLRYALCEQCNEHFDITNNTDTSCLFHLDVSVPEMDLFIGHDEYYDGIIESEDMRKHYPERFIYGCCGRTGEDEPCMVARHHERYPPSVFTSMEDSARVNSWSL